MPLRFRFFIFSALMSLLVFSVPALAQDSPPPGQPADSASGAKPPPAPAQEKPREAAKKDPCEAYKTSYEVYTVCQDRMHKIDRMKEAQTERDNDMTPKVKPEVKAKLEEKARAFTGGGALPPGVAESLAPLLSAPSAAPAAPPAAPGGP